ncbi:unnamed protein product [Ixodes hexagonus]
MNISELLDSRRQRNQVLFRKVQAEMEALGYRWSCQQLRTHWKNLKGRYNKAGARFSVSGAAPSTWTWFEEMSALLAHRPAEARECGIDSHAQDDWYDTRTGLNIAPRCILLGDCLACTFGCRESVGNGRYAEPPPKRPRRSKNAELAGLLAEQHRRNTDLLREHSQVLFQQQKQLLEEEKKNMQN